MFLFRNLPVFVFVDFKFRGWWKFHFLPAQWWWAGTFIYFNLMYDLHNIFIMISILSYVLLLFCTLFLRLPLLVAWNLHYCNCIIPIRRVLLLWFTSLECMISVCCFFIVCSFLYCIKFTCNRGNSIWPFGYISQPLLHLTKIQRWNFRFWITVVKTPRNAIYILHDCYWQRICWIKSFPQKKTQKNFQQPNRYQSQNINTTFLLICFSLFCKLTINLSTEREFSCLWIDYLSNV